MGSDNGRGSPTRARYVTVEDRLGMGLPYSKGLMATSIMATGLPPDQAYSLAEAIEMELIGWERETVSADDLAELAARVLTRRAGAEIAGRYQAWRRAKRSSKPIVVLIGGPTGVGKSTVATRLGARLGITRIIPTDAVREVMRNIISGEVMPSIHVSSFEVGGSVPGPWQGPYDPVLVGFQRQAEAVAAGLRGLIDRAIKEQVDIVVEGTHVVPGLLGYSSDGAAAVVEAVLAIDDPVTHRAHFVARQELEYGRRPQRYLEHFEQIRHIQTHLRKLAALHGVPEVQARDLDGTIQVLLEMVVEAMTSDEVPRVLAL